MYFEYRVCDGGLNLAEFWDVLDENGNATGRFHERGKPMGEGEYNLSVSVWIENDNGEFLISQRTQNKSYPGMWETTGGNAITGDDSLTTALKETYEELGITLLPQNGRIIKHQTRKCVCGHCLADVWLFRQNVDISTVTLAPEETCGAMWVSRDELDRMIAEGTFMTWGLFSCVAELSDELRTL